MQPNVSLMRTTATHEPLRRASSLAAVALAVVPVGCSSAPPTAGEDNDLSRSGGAPLTPDEDAAIRHVASAASLDVLDDLHHVRLRRDAVQAIVAYRATDSNHAFDTLDELYGVRGVGLVAIKQIRAYAEREGPTQKSGLVDELQVQNEACIACANEKCVTDVRDPRGVCAPWVACIEQCGCNDQACRFRFWGDMDGGCDGVLEDVQSCSWSTCEDECS